MKTIDISPEEMARRVVGEQLQSMAPGFHAKLLQAGISFTAGLD